MRQEHDLQLDVHHICGFNIAKAHEVGLNTSTKAGLWFEDKRTVFINESLIWFQSNSIFAVIRCRKGGGKDMSFLSKDSISLKP